ncbi:MAG: GNAT family N-acetyltransferase [Christensenellales bacterium]|jgi:GNAT superfamily N-acetyltransferase
MGLRKTKEEDVSSVLDLYREAREFMAEQGLRQWTEGYPGRDSLEKDRERGYSWVLEEEGAILGTAAYFIGEEPTYHSIEGAWGGIGRTAVVHRLAVAKAARKRQIATRILTELINKARTAGADWFRADTHRDNRPMRGLLEKLGFTMRGIIYVADGTPRVAYDLSLEQGEDPAE